MAKSFKEIGKKAEQLIEQGSEADKEVERCQNSVVSATNTLVSARINLATASQTDENGNSVGDVAMVMAQVRVAENALSASKRALATAQESSDRIRHQKNAHIQEIQKHNQVERSNLEKLKQLRSEAFGADSVAISAGIARRLNEAEDARVALLRSMGIAASPEYVADDESGEGGSVWNREGITALDLTGEKRIYKGGGSGGNIGGTVTGTSWSGGFGKVVGAIANGLLGQRNAHDLTPDNQVGFTNQRYTSREELSDELDRFACDYQAHPENYNNVIRNNGNSKDIEKFRNLINKHRIDRDTVFYRRASLLDLGDELSNIPLDNLVGKSYKFVGIMSTSDTLDLGNSVSSGTVIYEIKAPAGTPALDLTQITYFKEAMFDSPTCYIESVKPEGFNTTRIVVRILSNEEKSTMAQMSEKVKYNDTNQSMSQQSVFATDSLSTEYISTINNRYEKGELLARRVFDSFRNELCIRDNKYPTDQTPHYSPYGYPGHMRGVYYNASCDNNNPRGKGTTYFHELAHMIDHASTGYNGFLSNTEEFRTALLNDGQNVLALYNQLPKDRQYAFCQKLYQDSAHSFSDLIDATTNGQLHGAYGHSRDYWLQDGNLQAEAFAHFFEASMGCDEKREILSNFFPASFGIFSGMLENVSDSQARKKLGR